MKEKKISNITDLASLLNLSVSTISRVLNGKADKFRISQATQQRILQAAEQYQYKPNIIARGLKLDRTETLGLIVPDIADPFFAEIAKSIEKEAKTRGYMLILCDSNNSIDTEKELLNLLHSRRVDGLVIAPIGTDFSHIMDIYSAGLALVVVDRIPKQEKIPSVSSDNYTGAFEAVSYLVAMGHQRIACICGNRDVQPVVDRLQGYMDALKKHNIPFDSELVSGSSFSTTTGNTELKKLFALKNKPTAIFALNSLIGLGVLKAASEIHIKIPDDLSVISFDEQAYSPFLSPPMTTIEQNKQGIGTKAIDTLLKHIENPDYKTIAIEKLPVLFRARESVKKIS